MLLAAQRGPGPSSRTTLVAEGRAGRQAGAGAGRGGAARRGAGHVHVLVHVSVHGAGACTCHVSRSRIKEPLSLSIMKSPAVTRSPRISFCVRPSSVSGRSTASAVSTCGDTVRGGQGLLMLRGRVLTPSEVIRAIWLEHSPCCGVPHRAAVLRQPRAQPQHADHVPLQQQARLGGGRGAWRDGPGEVRRHQLPHRNPEAIRAVTPADSPHRICMRAYDALTGGCGNQRGWDVGR